MEAIYQKISSRGRSGIAITAGTFAILLMQIWVDFLKSLSESFPTTVGIGSASLTEKTYSSTLNVGFLNSTGALPRTKNISEAS